MIIIAEYIWLDNNKELRSKSKVINLNIDIKDKSKEINQMELIQSLMRVSLYPQWSYDGSPTRETSIDNSEINLLKDENFRLKKIIAELKNNSVEDKDTLIDLVVFLSTGVIIILMLENITKLIRKF